MSFESRVVPQALLQKLRCPQSGIGLALDGDQLTSVDGKTTYRFENGVPDLRMPPRSLRIDAPWYEPWDELDSLDLRPPAPIQEREGLPYHLSAELAEVARLQGAACSVLEVGCGEKQCQQWFEKCGFEYVGIDVDVRGRGPDVLADAHNLPFVDGIFDIYTSMAVYEHLVAPVVAAQEAYRVLKPGGIFIGSSAFVYGFHDRASFHHMSHAGLLTVLRTAGFHVEKIWSDWEFYEAIPEMAFRGVPGSPWRYLTKTALFFAEKSFRTISNIARACVRHTPVDPHVRSAHTAGSLSFWATKVQLEG